MDLAALESLEIHACFFILNLF